MLSKYNFSHISDASVTCLVHPKAIAVNLVQAKGKALSFNESHSCDCHEATTSVNLLHRLNRGGIWLLEDVSAFPMPVSTEEILFQLYIPGKCNNPAFGTWEMLNKYLQNGTKDF